MHFIYSTLQTGNPAKISLVYIQPTEGSALVDGLATSFLGVLVLFFIESLSVDC